MLKFQLITYNIGNRIPAIDFYEKDVDIIVIHIQEQCKNIFNREARDYRFLELQKQILADTHKLACIHSHGSLQQIIFIRHGDDIEFEELERKFLSLGRLGINQLAQFLVVKIAGQPMLFVNLHLQKQQQTERRAQFDRICCAVEEYQTKYGHNFIHSAIFGDFNTMLKCNYDTSSAVLYRAGLPIQGLKANDSSQLISLDNAYQRLKRYDTFNDFYLPDGFVEADMPSFEPTYKISKKGQYYSQRPPAWTDRIIINFGHVAQYYAPPFYECSHIPVVVRLFSKGDTEVLLPNNASQIFTGEIKYQPYYEAVNDNSEQFVLDDVETIEREQILNTQQSQSKHQRQIIEIEADENISDGF